MLPELWMHPLQPESIAVQTAMGEVGFQAQPYNAEHGLQIHLSRFAERWPQKQVPVLFLKDREIAGFSAIADYAQCAQAQSLAADDDEAHGWARQLAEAEHKLNCWHLGLPALELENPEQHLEPCLTCLNNRLKTRAWLGGQQPCWADCWAGAALLSSAMRNRLGDFYALNEYFQRWLERDSYWAALCQANRLMLRYCAVEQRPGVLVVDQPELIQHFYKIGLIGDY